MVGPGVARSWPLAALAGALAMAGVAVAHAVPASMLARAERPYEGRGHTAVRTEALSYPRYATGADDVRTKIERPPRRIVSQYWSTDEFLYSVVPPERIVGVSDSAFNRGVSNVLRLVELSGPIVAMDPERVLGVRPDLV